MARWLDYATQVSELEKMARLSSAAGAVIRDPPALVEADGDAACLVCGARPARSCAVCRAVCYCGVAHQHADARWHDLVCDVLREIGEDGDLSHETWSSELVAFLAARAERGADPGTLSGWTDYWGPDLAPELRRRLSAGLTRPLTLARALAALEVATHAARPGVLAIHVMGASRREQEVAPAAWAEVVRFFPGTRLELALVGPELPERTSAPEPGDPRVRIRTHSGLYRRSLWRELGRPDLVIGYDCGLLMYPSWRATVLDLRGSGAPFVITSYRPWEAVAEARVLAAVEATCLLEPGPNPFASLAGKRSSTIANDVSFDNALVGAWR